MDHSYSEWREHYRFWYGIGFHGGYYWDVHPYWDIDNDYYRPNIYWFYNDSWDDSYYSGWYGADAYSTWPIEYRTPFRYQGFFPAEEFVNLNMDITGTPISLQIAYRRGMEALATQLVAEVYARGGDGTLHESSVVITHYQLLLDSEAIVLDGFVSQDGIQFPFKALVDLSNPDSPELFVPNADESQPTPDEITQLNELDAHIQDLGGQINQAN